MLLLVDFEIFSSLPIDILGFPVLSSFKDPIYTFPYDVPTAKFIPLGLNTAHVTSSSAWYSGIYWIASIFNVSIETVFRNPFL